MRLARERFKLAQDAEAAWREECLDDHKFRIGEQWIDEIKKQRGIRKLPCLTINRIPRTIAQVTNEQRQQRPAGQVNPVGDGADKETADIIQGAIRHIEVQSDADIAKDMAFDDMVTGGIGWIRLVNKYVSDDSDEQELYFEPIENWASVYSDPYESYYRQARWRFITKDLGVEEYKEQYPDSELAGINSEMWGSIGDRAPGWIRSDGVRVAEYFFMEEVTGSRKPTYRVFWTIINGIEELEERTQWLVDDEIPVFPVKGEEKIVDGKKHLAGLVRYSKDPARMYNVWISAATTMIGMAPRPKFVAAAGQVEDFLGDWENANDPERILLRYKSMDISGHLVPPPAMQSFEPPIQALAVMTKQADNDFKATTGIYDASLGEKGPDESGKAILARQKQTDIAILNFSDNLSRTLLKIYRHCIKWIQKGYSERKLLRIIKPDGSVDMVHVNGAELKQGVKKVYDLRVGDYDVVVTVGPSYQTKRQEAVATQLELAKSFPVVAQAAPDLMIRNMDIPQADEIADRVKLTLPPPILQSLDQDAIPQLQSKLAQASQQIELLSKTNTELLQKAQGHEAKAQADIQMKQMDIASKERIIKMQEVTKIAVAQLTASKDANEAFAQREADQYGLLHQTSHEAAQQAAEHAHEKAMATLEHQQTMKQAEQSQSHALEQGEQSGQQQAELAQMAAENTNGAGQ